MLGRLLHSCPIESPRCVGATSAPAAVKEISSAMPDPSHKQLHVLWLFPRWPVYVVMICNFVCIFISFRLNTQPDVIFASPVEQPLRAAHSLRSVDPAARWIQPSTVIKQKKTS